MAYEKADFWAAYRSYPRTEQNWRMVGFRHPDLNGLVDYDPETGVTLVQHYVRAAVKPQSERKAQIVVDHFIDEGTPLSGTSTIVIIGGAFGWLGEAIEDLIPGLEACSVDLSQYVQDKKSVSDDDELIENIIASGYDHTLPNSVGEWLYNQFSDPTPRCRNPQRVVQSALSNPSELNAVKALFRENTVTHIVTEEVWQILTQEEKDRYTAAAAAYGAPVAHIINGVII